MTGAADLVITNADIHTMDAFNTHGEAIAIKNGRVLAVGREDDISNLAGATTKHMNAGGRVLLPGFQDTHIHLAEGGLALHTGADLAGVRTLENLQELVRKQAAETPDKLWVQGFCWNPGVFLVADMNRHLIDAAVSDRPVYLMAMDGHNAVVNTRALQELNITADTPNPPNGEIVRDEAGDPTGMFFEDAIFWAYGQLPKATQEEWFEGTKIATRLANKHGLTGILDAMSGESIIKTYTGLDNAGELTVRVAATSKINPEDSVKDALGRLNFLRETYRSEKVYMHSAKFFLDGVMDNNTAAMLEDFATGGNAPIMFDEDHLQKLMIAFDAERYQLHLHTIGDRAVRVALDGIEAARKANGPWPALHQLAHIDSIHDNEIPRFAELGVVANFQPYWACLADSLPYAIKLVGEERSKNIFALKSILETGAPYAISSDWSVTTLNPFEIMAVAVSRQSPFEDFKGPVFNAEQCISIEDVVRGYTLNAAAAAWRSDTTGSLTTGSFADLILLDRDIFKSTPQEISGTQVDLTMLGGEAVYRS
ncbi:MAG: amidohydrolase, partial [Rhodospirillales bacterium]|nr:amidohydrolase [Rhodospirillales bacterium]